MAGLGDPKPLPPSLSQAFFTDYHRYYNVSLSPLSSLGEDQEALSQLSILLKNITICNPAQN